MNSTAINNCYLDFVQRRGLISLINDNHVDLNAKEILVHVYCGSIVKSRHPTPPPPPPHPRKKKEKKKKKKNIAQYLQVCLLILRCSIWNSSARITRGNCGKDSALSVCTFTAYIIYKGQQLLKISAEYNKYHYKSRNVRKRAF